MVPLHHTQDNTSDSYGGSRLNSWAFATAWARSRPTADRPGQPFYQWSPVNMQFYFR